MFLFTSAAIKAHRSQILTHNQQQISTTASDQRPTVKASLLPTQSHSHDSKTLRIPNQILQHHRRDTSSPTYNSEDRERHYAQDFKHQQKTDILPNAPPRTPPTNSPFRLVHHHWQGLISPLPRLPCSCRPNTRRTLLSSQTAFAHRPRDQRRRGIYHREMD